MKRARGCVATLAFVFGLAAAAPAQAADPQQIGCPLGIISNAQRLAMGDAARELAPESDPRLQPLRAAALACARRWDWSQGANDWSVRFHVALGGQRAQRRWLIAAGIDVAAIEQATRADEALIASTVAGTFREEIRAFQVRHAAVIAQTLRDHDPLTEELGKLVGFIAATEGARRAFTAN